MASLRRAITPTSGWGLSVLMTSQSSDASSGSGNPAGRLGCSSRARSSGIGWSAKSSRNQPTSLTTLVSTATMV